MSSKAKVQGGALGLIGFLLSPLSWWNDAIVNLPLAIAFGWIVGLVYKPAFRPAVVLGYWLTNVAGLVLMHKGLSRAVGKPERKYTWRTFAKDIAVSGAYTGLIVILIRLKILQPFSDYFAAPAR